MNNPSSTNSPPCTTHTPTPNHPSHILPPNIPWGDQLTPIPPHEQTTTLRIAFQNANGLSPQHNWSAWTHACSFIKQHNISVFGAVETNLVWTAKNKHLLQKHSMKHLTTPRTIATSCSTHHSQSHFQPGGTLLLSSGRWTR